MTRKIIQLRNGFLSSGDKNFIDFARTERSW